MLSVAKAVEHILSQKPFIQEGLARGIINNAALANEMIPEVEKLIKKKVKFSAVNMAIRRLTEKMELTFIKQAKFDKNCDITVRSDLIQITVFKIGEVQNYIRELYNIVDYKKGDFFTITQGLYEVMIITNKRYEKEILSLFPQKVVKKVIRNLSGITIKIPEESSYVVGLFYLITRAMAWENIPIVDIVSTYTETTLTVREDDTTRAFNSLQQMIKENSL